ncbi:MAG: hypothetical protein M2R45_04525 [Verrucomicrobia subdivision 3 bacterium]|nr:hypothetical protein [Limisphaerales bacterium]MCS1416836.1 hypothetical protein [Limisphaerales bacterium]
MLSCQVYVKSQIFLGVAPLVESAEKTADNPDQDFTLVEVGDPEKLGFFTITQECTTNGQRWRTRMYRHARLLIPNSKGGICLEVGCQSIHRTCDSA